MERIVPDTVTDAGISIEVKAQLMNAPFPIVCKAVFASKMTAPKLVQLWNASTSIVVTDCRIPHQGGQCEVNPLGV